MSVESGKTELKERNGLDLKYQIYKIDVNFSKNKSATYANDSVYRPNKSNRQKVIK